MNEYEELCAALELLKRNLNPMALEITLLENRLKCAKCVFCDSTIINCKVRIKCKLHGLQHQDFIGACPSWRSVVRVVEVEGVSFGDWLIVGI